MARLYAEMIISGEVPACRYTILACKRFVRMLKEAEKPKNRFYYSKEWVVDSCSFIEKLARPDSEPPDDIRFFVIQPCQAFWLANLFGFRRGPGFSPIEQGERLFREVYLEVPRGSGKALALDTPIPTPSGWSTMGELSVGDVVFAQDGTETRIIGATDVMHDHKCYRVKFSNGEEVIADADHLWITTARVNEPGGNGKVKSRYRAPSLKKQRIGNHEYWYAQLYRRQKCLGRVGIDDDAIQQTFEVLSADDLQQFPLAKDCLTRVRTTDEIARTLRYGRRGDFNHSVAMPSPISCEEADLPIDPYIFGYWLGDGDTDAGRITCGEQDLNHLVRQIENSGYLPSVRKTHSAYRVACLGPKRGTGSLHCDLRDAGFLGNKRIPQEYLRASYEQRLSLLQGLMDSDGGCDRDGSAQEFSSKCDQLASDVSELCASLGIRHSVTKKPARCSGKLVGYDVSTIRFCVKRDEIPVFRLSRKLDRMTSSDERKAWRTKSVQIVACDPVESVPVRCIKVDHPTSTYLFGRTMLPTHNSPFAGAVAFFCYLEEGAGGSQIFVCGPKEDQARYVFDPMTVMAEHSPGLQDHYGLIVTKKGIRKASNENSKVRMISSIADREDGANPHVVVMEELHAQDESLFNVMDSSLGKRPNNLFLSITTAGNRATGVCYNTRRRLIQILEGVTDDESFFGVIYTLDDHEIKDKKIAHDPARWIKANPMWGITLVPSSLMERYTKAKNQSPAAVLEFERTRLNIWSNGAGGLVDPDNWNNCFNAELKRSDLKGKTCWVGADLASKNDITAVGIMFNERGMVQIFNRYYVPELSAAFKHSEVGPLYQGWVESGHLITTAGAITDYNAIELDIREWAQEHEMVVAVFDRYQSNHVLTNLYNDGLPAMDMSSGIQTISDPAKDFFALIEGGILEHDGHPVTTWMAMNVVGYIDSRSNLLPKKDEPNSPFKIDGIAALIAANTARLDKQLNVDTKKPDVYEQRGLIGADDD